MSIGVFSRRTWLSPKALRFYDRKGLLVPAVVDAETGYRRYTESQLADARLIRSLRQLDMPLEQIAALLKVSDAERAAVITDYWHAVERELARQRFLSEHLRLMFSTEKGQSMFNVNVRDMADQLVLTEQRYVTAADLTDWIQAALSRQHHELGSHAQAAASFVVYHGDVTEDSDGPVEACTPIPAEKADQVSLPTRTEPAHREAYVSLTRSQIEYPQILTAYRTVEQWAAEYGHTVSAPPREIYFGDFTQDEGPVADVAFPISSDGGQ